LVQRDPEDPIAAEVVVVIAQLAAVFPRALRRDRSSSAATATLFVGLLGLVPLAGLDAPAQAAVTLEQIGAPFQSPVRLVAPLGDDRLFVVQQNGLIIVTDRSGEPRRVFLDVSDLTIAGGERGLLGLAFAPDYATSGRFYIDYTDASGDTQIARYHVSGDDPDAADPASAEILLSVDQPYSNHNGGHLEFGPDGMLYVGLGDGGSAGDPQNRAQNDALLLGKLLRIDVSGDVGYAIPTGNPFVGAPPRDEIWAKGLRNPWCFSFDRLTGDLYIADVGQSALEEVDVQPAGSGGGENYGWRLMEGTACYNPASGCNDGSLVLPVFEYAHSGAPPSGCSISGGYVYRGAALPELGGQYFFADYCSNQIWSFVWSPTAGATQLREWTSELLPDGGFGNIAAFGRDGRGELYVLDHGNGRVYRIVGATPTPVDVPQAPRLEQNIPNPFNPQTTIAFIVPNDGTEVNLTVYDPFGRPVRTLVAGLRPAGRNVVAFDGRDDAGRPLAAGVYLYRLKLLGVEETRKLTMLR
jgi:glucose/arabinose dehydrogenase